MRPAAGMPAAPITGPMAEPDQSPEPSTHQPGQPRPYGSTVPDELKQTGPSAATQARPFGGSSQPPRPSSGAASVQTADPRRKGPPRPAAGNLATQQSPSHQPPPGRAREPELEPEDEFDHPSDGDGPTIQALPPMVDALTSASLGPRLGDPMRADSGSMEQASPSEGPTMMASPRTRAALVGAAPVDDEVYVIEPDEEEDQDATMVANARADANPLQAPPTFPQVAPAAGRTSPPAPPSVSPQQQQTRPPPPRMGQTAGFNQQQLPPMHGPMGYPQQPPMQQQAPMPMPMQPPQMQGPQGNEPPFNETLGMPHGQLSAPPYDPNDYGRNVSNAPQELLPRSGPHPTGHSGEFIPRQSVAAHGADHGPHGARLRQSHGAGPALQAAPTDVGRGRALMLDRAAHRRRRHRGDLVDQHAGSEDDDRELDHHAHGHRRRGRNRYRSFRVGPRGVQQRP